MKKLISLFAMLLIASNVSFAATELGEDAAADCISTRQSGRFQQGLSDGESPVKVESEQSVIR